jgi:hypothetical protein
VDCHPSNRKIKTEWSFTDINYQNSQQMGKNKKTTPLSHDIKQIFIKAYGRETEMIRLCRDHHDPLTLMDKKPVLNITQDDFVSIFNPNSKHFYLSPEGVCRFGTYCGLNLPNLVALMLKAEWEIYFYKTSGNSAASGGADKTEKTYSDFRPDVPAIFKLIRSLSNEPGADYGQIDFLVRDLILRKNFLLDNDSAGKSYPDKDITEGVMLRNSSSVEKETYLRLRELWKVKATGLDGLLFNLERKKRLNLETENKYFRIFGKDEFEKARLRFRINKYMIIEEIIKDIPGLSFRELLRMAKDRMTEAERNKNDLRNKIIRSRNRIDVTALGYSRPPVTKEFEDAYMQECKKLLRKLYLLLHTDTCPDYTSLSENKKVEINKLWLDLMKSTKNEIFSFSPNMLLYSLPDLDSLRSIYNRACEILGIDPECFETGDRLEFMIRKGVPVNRIIEFLKNETEQIELHLAHLELIQNEYTNEDQTQKYMDGLENIKSHTDKLKGEIDALKEKLSVLKRRISEQFIKAAV